MTLSETPDRVAVRVLEVCVESFQDAVLAVDAGADRIEYCSALALGGLTPSPGALAMIGNIKAPCMVMIRPRPGNFCYDANDCSIMKQEIAMARACGAAGVVFGATDDAGQLDTDILRDLMAESAGLQVTLHRAFDEVHDQFGALEQAINLGFERILTSGGAPDAITGIDRIAALTERAAGRIVILPGAGISSANAADILNKSGAHELHASCKTDVAAKDDGAGRVRVAPDRVRALKNAMDI